MTVPLIIDTDTAQDDCVTIIAAMMDPLADVRAITMVAGNVGFDRQVHNAHLTQRARPPREVPIHLGCRRRWCCRGSRRRTSTVTAPVGCTSTRRA